MTNQPPPFRCEACRDDAGMHDFYVAGGGFRWRWPKLTVYVPADRRTRAQLNRYPHNVIGAGVVILGRCIGVTWKGSRR